MLYFHQHISFHVCMFFTFDNLSYCYNLEFRVGVAIYHSCFLALRVLDLMITLVVQYLQFDFGFKVQVVHYRVQALGFRAQYFLHFAYIINGFSLGFRVIVRLRIYGLGFRIKFTDVLNVGSYFRVQGVRFRAYVIDIPFIVHSLCFAFMSLGSVLTALPFIPYRLLALVFTVYKLYDLAFVNNFDDVV